MKKIIFLIILVLFLFNCQYFEELSYKEWLKKIEVDKVYNTFIAGSYIGYLCYWKNDVLFDNLEDNDGAQLSSMFAKGENIYICGTAGSGEMCYWKNENGPIYTKDLGVASGTNRPSFYITRKKYITD